jgi:hypothetical protein
LAAADLAATANASRASKKAKVTLAKIEKSATEESHFVMRTVRDCLLIMEPPSITERSL